MLTSTQKELLKQMKMAAIERHGSISEASRSLGISRWGMRKAVLGGAPKALRKMQEAGLVVPISVATNSLYAGYESGGIVVAACNARALSGGEWEQITPYGDFPNPQGIQRLNKITCQRMVDAFNSSRSRSPLGVPIFRGHPDVDPKNYPDDRRYGKITALEARSDGFWCKPAFNSIGKENQEQGYWVFPSGVWKFKRMPGGVIEPTELLSVGLTNSPIIPTVQPWARNAASAEDDLSDNPAIRAAQLLYRRTLSTARNSSNKAASNAELGAQVKKAALDYQAERKCDWATAWNAQKKDARFIAYFALSVGANSLISATTPGAAKTEAKALLKEHKVLMDGYNAIGALAKRADQLRKEKGLGHHEALLQAHIDLPEEAATAAKHAKDQNAKMDEKARQEKLKDFVSAVKARMERQKISYSAAWAQEKAARKSKSDWTPDSKNPENED